jgi:hypothetical protein
MNITPEPSNHSQLIENFQTLLNKYVYMNPTRSYKSVFSSFFIIQHPSPPIATHSTRVNGGVTAKINSRIICLLDRSQATISIDNISEYHQNNLHDNA